MTATLTGIRVRPAVDDDARYLGDQLTEFAKFYGTRKSLMPERWEDAMRVVEAIIFDNPCFIAEKPAAVFGMERVGFIAGNVAPHPYNPSITVLNELFWWVAPEHRGSRAGMLLLDAFTEYGKAHADWTVMTLEAHSPVRSETLTKRGYRAHETSFLLERDNG